MIVAKTNVVSKFNVGRIYMTRGAADYLNQDDVFDALVRHMDGNWGELDEYDWKANDEALEFGFRLLSSYLDRNRVKFWIITEANRTQTTILLPREY